MLQQFVGFLAVETTNRVALSSAMDHGIYLATVCWHNWEPICPGLITFIVPSIVACEVCTW